MSTNLILLFHIVPSATWFASTLKKVGQLSSFISIEDIESYYHDRDRNFNNCCHVCFDDGEISVYANAFLVLKETNIPAPVFVSPRIVKEGCNYWFQELRHIRKKLGDGPVKRQISDMLGCNH
ncbi:MAG: hypothetical protein JSW03_06860 [Candidatus Eiseniibacteriota bacterium]|nr:MAG: hypothetical protein JSW03_06860 [Candidatus Eisenbacteria bacterium]